MFHRGFESHPLCFLLKDMKITYDGMRTTKRELGRRFEREEVESGVFCIAKHVDLFIADEQGSPILSVYVKKYKNRVCA